MVTVTLNAGGRKMFGLRVVQGLGVVELEAFLEDVKAVYST